MKQVYMLSFLMGFICNSAIFAGASPVTPDGRLICDYYNKDWCSHGNMAACNSTETCSIPDEGKRSHCYALWDNASVVRMKGCWLDHSPCYDKQECVVNEVVDGRLFCCCEGLRCNAELVIPPTHPIMHPRVGLRDYCQGEALAVTCSDDEVIVIRSALYGRMTVGRCVPSDYGGHIGCRVTVLRQMDRLCSGRQSCHVSVSDRTFGNPRPCSQNLPSYLEVIYECLKVHTATGANCARNEGVLLRRPTGFISSHITGRYGYGSPACPWKIELPWGQRVNITFIDFSTPIADAGQGLARGSFNVSRPCYVYGMLTEKRVMTRNIRICSGVRREKNIYTSKTNSVEIRLFTKRKVETEQNFYFLLQIEAIGCPEPQPPSDSNGPYSMGCNSTGRYWRVICEGSKWVGRYENCTKG